MTAVSGPRRRVGKEIAARLIGARGLPIGLRIWALVARRPIDSLGILTAGVASIVIIINAVFLQPGFRQGTDRSEGLGERFQSSNHMGCLKRPHSVDGKPKMQLSGFMESVV